jgi:hypothetical protein
LELFPADRFKLFPRIAFSKIKKELPPVALFSQEKNAIPFQKALYFHQG